MDPKALLRLDSVVCHIDAIQNDLHGVSLEAFKENDLLLRATCFSVVQIGEAMNKLEVLFAEKYPKLPWRLSNRVKNFLVHDYDSVDAQIVYETVQDDLPTLRVAILAIKNDMVEGSLQTSRLILRKFEMKDAQSMFENWASDPEVARYLTWNPHQNVAETESILRVWIAEEDKPEVFRYAIVEKGTDAPIGSIDVVGWKENCPEVGCCLGRRFWNKGYMTEAFSCFCTHLFELGYERILIGHDERNKGSQRVIEKNGFSFLRKEKRVMKGTERTLLYYEKRKPLMAA